MRSNRERNSTEDPLLGIVTCRYSLEGKRTLLLQTSNEVCPLVCRIHKTILMRDISQAFQIRASLFLLFTDCGFSLTRKDQLLDHAIFHGFRCFRASSRTTRRGLKTPASFEILSEQPPANRIKFKF